MPLPQVAAKRCIHTVCSPSLSTSTPFRPFAGGVSDAETYKDYGCRRSPPTCWAEQCCREENSHCEDWQHLQYV